MSNWPTGIPLSSTEIPDSTATHHAADWYANVIQPISDSFVALLGDADWTPLTLAGAWVYWGSPFAVPAVRKFGDSVMVKGTIKSGALGALFTLPVGYRPAFVQTLFGVSNSVQAAAIQVATSGVVSVLSFGGGNNGYLTLDGLTFNAGT